MLSLLSLLRLVVLLLRVAGVALVGSSASHHSALESVSLSGEATRHRSVGLVLTSVEVAHGQSSLEVSVILEVLTVVLVGSLDGSSLG